MKAKIGNDDNIDLQKKKHFVLCNILFRPVFYLISKEGEDEEGKKGLSLLIELDGCPEFGTKHNGRRSWQISY